MGVIATYLLGSLDLDDKSKGLRILEESSLWGGPSGRRVTQLETYGRPGVQVPDRLAPPGPRTLALKLLVLGDTPAQLHARLAALHTALQVNSVITRKVAGLPDVVADFVQVADVDWPDMGLGLSRAEVTIPLLLTEGVWREIGATTATVPADGVSVFMPMGDAAVYDPILTFPAGNNTLVVAGSGPTWDSATNSWIRLAGETTAPTVVDLATWNVPVSLDFGARYFRLAPGSFVNSSRAGTTVTYRRRWFA